MFILKYSGLEQFSLKIREVWVTVAIFDKLQR